MPRAVPNKKNNVKLTTTQANNAQAAMQNFFSGPGAFPWPPLTDTQSKQMAAAVAPFLAEINKVQQTSAKQLTVPTPPTLIAAQENPIGATLPAVAKFLPAGTDLASTSFAAAISSMQDTVAALQALAANPTSLGAQSARDPSLNQYYKNK